MNKSFNYTEKGTTRKRRYPRAVGKSTGPEGRRPVFQLGFGEQVT